MDVFKTYKEDDYDDILANENIINLTLKSQFVKHIPVKIYEEFLNSSKQYNKLIPTEMQGFLKKFFEQDLDMYQQWSDALDQLNVNNNDFKKNITKQAIQLIIKTLDNFLQAFSLGHMNPLYNTETWNNYTLMIIYIHTLRRPCGTMLNREISSVNHVKYQKEDGVGFTSGLDQYQIMYAEGTRLYKVTAKKETQNQVNNQKVIIPEMEVFGIFSFKRKLHMYILGYSGTYYIKEVESVAIPRDFKEMRGLSISLEQF
ncbi:16137_t:CDS:2 [Gigaspora margarita]|uniref:16137_t:CDS:1 n=1 Tax=Gigaspora margarita TaxID=4874 RepID=A0ABN7UNL8_GIGMA|nr:16137_t:CDS:2 [Gigaspora margarita]